MAIYNENNRKKYRKERFYGAYIHRLRKYYEVPQKDLAKILHISNSALSRMEFGKLNMDLDLFDHAIEYFEKYDPDYKFNRKPVYTFLEENDLSQKTIIPFVTHGGSAMAGTVETIRNLKPQANVKEDGLSLSRNDLPDSRIEILPWINQQENEGA